MRPIKDGIDSTACLPFPYVSFQCASATGATPGTPRRKLKKYLWSTPRGN